MTISFSVTDAILTLIKSFVLPISCITSFFIVSFNSSVTLVPLTNLGILITTLPFVTTSLS